MWFGWVALVNAWLFVINPGNGHDFRAKACCACDCWGRAAVVGSLKWSDEFANSCWIIKTLTKVINYVDDNPSLLVDFGFFTALSGDQGRIVKQSFFITLKSWVIFISVKSLYFSSKKSTRVSLFRQNLSSQLNKMIRLNSQSWAKIGRKPYKSVLWCDEIYHLVLLTTFKSIYLLHKNN